VTRRDQIAALDVTTGKVEWSLDSESPAWGPPRLYHEGDVLLALFDQYRLTRLDPSNGKVLWEESASRSPVSGLADQASMGNGFWILVTKNGIDCRSVDTGRLVWHGESDQIVDARIYYSQVLALMKSPSRYQWVTWQISDGKQMDSKTVPLPGEHPRIHWAERGAVIITETGAVGLVQNTKSSPIGQEK
jgi:outer membrane protein assembly factor BamB